MTRKDYVALADALLSARNECKELAEVRGVNWTVRYVGDKLAADNPRFDRGRFERACWGEREPHGSISIPEHAIGTSEDAFRTFPSLRKETK